jgi:hypothetical protein
MAPSSGGKHAGNVSLAIPIQRAPNMATRGRVAAASGINRNNIWHLRYTVSAAVEGQNQHLN